MKPLTRLYWLEQKRGPDNSDTYLQFTETILGSIKVQKNEIFAKSDF